MSNPPKGLMMFCLRCRLYTTHRRWHTGDKYLCTLCGSVYAASTGDLLDLILKMDKGGTLKWVQEVCLEEFCDDCDERQPDEPPHHYSELD